jgi:hypothetical protein
MKIKIIGFKVGQSRPTANRTVDMEKHLASELGLVVFGVLEKSDFISIRRVDD